MNKQQGGFNHGNVTITGGTVGGFPVNSISDSLFVLRGANLQSTADQAFTKTGNFTNYVITNVVCVCKTGGATVVCAGGIYTGASKAGDAIVAAAQSWVAASAVGLAVLATVANLLAKLESAVTNLSLTTGSTAAATADFFIMGEIVD